MATELDLLREEYARLRRIVEGDRGDNGLCSRVQALEHAQSHDDAERSSKNQDRRDLGKTLLFAFIISAVGRAAEWIWRMMQVREP